MAIEPITGKAILLLAKKAATDKDIRRIIVVAILIPLIVILLVLASPFGIFFAITGGDSVEEGMPISNVMQNLKYEFSNKIDLEQSTGYGIDETQIIVMGSEDGTIIDNSGDVLALFAVEVNANSENGEQVVMLSDNQVKRLEDIYWSMNIVTSEIVEVEVNEDNQNSQDTKTVTKRIKKTYVNSLTYEEVLDDFSFNDVQLQLFEEMISSEYVMLLAGATGSAETITMTQEEILKIKEMLPPDLDVKREKIVMTAHSIVGKVKYFWGGKSHAIGWDNRWGQMREVTSLGSSSTGTVRPFGLDCSGYVTWVFINAGVPVEHINDTIGHGVTRQWELSIPISKHQVLPGDIAIFYIPGTRKTNHVGIVVGTEEDKIMVAHCASGSNNIVVTEAKTTGFRYFRRPVVLIKEVILN